MAMSVGGSGDGDPEVMVDINTTPLIDVMLVLRIMLIITIPIQTHAVKLNMPVGNPPPPLTPPEVMTAQQTAELLQLDEKTVLELAEGGDLPGKKLGKQWRFSRAAVLSWLAATT